MNNAITYDWTSCQQQAISDITAWSYNPNQLFWTLNGAAGTGKSTCLTEILANVKQRYGICVSAPTHKAVKIVSAITELRGETIQKLLGLRPDMEVDKYDPNKPQFKRLGKPSIDKYSLIIIDEASMINKELFEALKEQATYNRVKLLFVGDELQLPPVGEKKSLVFEVENVHGISTLRTPARQKPSNPLTVMLLALRNDLDFSNESFDYLTKAIDTFEMAKGNNLMEQLASNSTNTFQVLRKHCPALMNGDEGYRFTGDKEPFDETLTAAFTSSEFLDDKNFAKYIAYTNSNVSKYNEVIRNELLDTKEKLVVGDYMMAYSSILDWKSKTNILTNSAEYEVVEINPFITREGIEAYDVTLQEIGGSFTNIVIVNPIDDYKQFLLRQQKPYWAALKDRRKWRDYFSFKNNHLIMDDLNKIHNKKHYPRKDIDYGYGCTVHKSQGSTFNIALVDGRDIATSYSIGIGRITKYREPLQADKDFLRRQALSLMYVAASRAKDFSMILI